MTRIEWPASSRPAGATSGDPLMITSGGHRPGESVHGGDPAEAVLQAAEGTVHAQVMPGITATVRRLLAAYASTLDVLDGLPATPMIATRWHWWSRPSEVVAAWPDTSRSRAIAGFVRAAIEVAANLTDQTAAFA